MLDNSRWRKSESYVEKWSDRSRFMLSVFDESIEDAAKLNVTEYGCGPNAPFSKAVAPSGRPVARYDLRAWDEGCKVVDLNEAGFQAEATDCGVLSGVVEYLNDFGATLEVLAPLHRYILFSYFLCEPRPWEVLPSQRVTTIRKRIVRNGWRNHMRLDDVLGCVARVGFLRDLRTYERQTIFLVERF